MPPFNSGSLYGESLKNETNKAIHCICVPIIFFSIVGLFYAIKFPVLLGGLQLNIAMIGKGWQCYIISTLAKRFGLGCLVLCHLIEKSGIVPL